MSSATSTDGWTRKETTEYDVYSKLHLCPTVEHVPHVLHPLPRWVKLLLSGSDGARDLDERAEQSETPSAEQAELLSSHLTDDRRQFPSAQLLAGNS